MAEKTIYDTGQARSVVIDEFASRYGYNVADLFPTPPRYWKANFNRGRGKGYSSLTDSSSNGEIDINLTMGDDGLYAQETADSEGMYNGSKYPSDTPPRDNTPYTVAHITEVTEHWSTYQEVQNKIKDLIQNLEEMIINGNSN